QYLMHNAQKVLQDTISIDKRNKTATLTVNSFNNYPVPLQRRAFQLTLDYLYEILPEQLTYVHEQIFFSLLHKKRSRAVNFPDRLVVARSYDQIVFYFEKENQKNELFHKIIKDIPTCISLPNG